MLFLCELLTFCVLVVTELLEPDLLRKFQATLIKLLSASIGNNEYIINVYETRKNFYHSLTHNMLLILTNCFSTFNLLELIS